MKISEELAETEYNSFISKDESVPFNENITLLNILTPEGYGFRIRASTERDELLYLRAVSNADKQKALVQDVYLKFNEKYMGSVKAHQICNTTCTTFSLLFTNCQIFKQWLDSQLLLQHFSEELVELIALKPFVDPAPYSIPHSVENGFYKF